MYSSRRVQIAYLKANEAPTKVFSKYIDLATIFQSKLAAELLEYTGINIHFIE